ncbi:MAG: Ldh family oxidoreductase [Pseudomonadota bacterium]
MNTPPSVRSKLELADERVPVPLNEMLDLVSGIFTDIGCSERAALQIAEHLSDSNLCGMESHGLMRTLQYAEQFESGYMRADVDPELRAHQRGGKLVDGNGGHGIPAMHLALEAACAEVAIHGISVLGIVNVGHTGRLGAFAEAAAEKGNLCVIFGGGGRERWRQVAPHGGIKAMLPTNPYCIGIPGGERGPVVLDFATSKIAGGWIYAARSAGAKLPDNALMNTEGSVSRDPEDYFRGGAIMPAGGAKGYALALVAEIMAEAMLGPTTTEGGWLMITLDTTRYQDAGTMRAVAEEILDELRNCPPAPGFDRVEIPGEREREHRERTQDQGIAMPRQTWEQMQALAKRLSNA